ncbi:MAG: hypothetical protein KA257_12000 [Opitutaceae bacterium]|nr:hypothetical protein [Opitutaceae bacterium]MBP9911877.1 hypothetical protein [Opitutaceae bacterium]
MLLRKFWLLAVLFWAVVAGSVPAADWRGETRLVWHGNVTNADRAADRLAAIQSQTEVAVKRRWVLPAGNQVWVGWQFGLDAWPRFAGLDTLAGGPVLGWSHKFGLGAQVPVLVVQAAGEWVAAREEMRAGRGGALELRLQRRFGSDWQLAGGVEWEKYRARGHAFRRAGREYFLRTDYQMARWNFMLELHARTGVVVSYTSPPRPDLVQAGKVLTLVDTFERESSLLAYYFPADTRSGAVEATRGLDAQTAVFLRFEYRDTTHNAVRYLNQLSSLGIRREF